MAFDVSPVSPSVALVVDGLSVPVPTGDPDVLLMISRSFLLCVVFPGRDDVSHAACQRAAIFECVIHMLLVENKLRINNHRHTGAGAALTTLQGRHMIEDVALFCHSYAHQLHFCQ